MKTRVSIAVALVLATSSVAAHAQQAWLGDRRYSEGEGYRAGNVELHPGIAGEVGYDSNLFRRSGDAPAETRISAYRLRITPSFSLQTLGVRRRIDSPAPFVQFDMGAYVAYNKMFATESQFSEDVSRQRKVDIGADFKLELNRSGRGGADIYGDYVRVAEPSNSVDPEFAFDRSTLRGGLGATWRPGGGLFEWRLGYELVYNAFEATVNSRLDNLTHFIKTRGRFRFLPRTAVVYDAHMGFRSYLNGTPELAGSQTVQSRVGLSGLITNHFAFLTMVGWASSFYDQAAGQPQNFDSVVGQAELKWFLMPMADMEAQSAGVGLSSVALGYSREFQNSYLGNYYGRDRVYTDFRYLLGGTMLFLLRGGYSIYSYPESFFANGQPQAGDFRQGRVDATVFAEYRLADSFGINSTLTYEQNLGANRIPASPGATVADNLAYSRYTVFVGARWFM